MHKCWRTRCFGKESRGKSGDYFSDSGGEFEAENERPTFHGWPGRGKSSYVGISTNSTWGWFPLRDQARGGKNKTRKHLKRDGNEERPHKIRPGDDEHMMHMMCSLSAVAYLARAGLSLGESFVLSRKTYVGPRSFGRTLVGLSVLSPRLSTPR